MRKNILRNFILNDDFIVMSRDNQNLTLFRYNIITQGIKDFFRKIKQVKSAFNWRINNLEKYKEKQRRYYKQKYENNTNGYKDKKLSYYHKRKLDNVLIG